jgi:hypothetical protein
VDRIQATLTEVEALYRVEYTGALPPTDYGRVRLASALRDAASSQQSWTGSFAWLRRVSGSFTGGSVSRSLAAGVVAIAMCAGALIALRAGTEGVAPALPAGALPQSSLTPGAVSDLTAAELCNGVRPSRLVTETVRQQVVGAYRMEHLPAAAYELDALITPELGGSTDPANLWPQRYYSPVWNAHVKDQLERLLPALVCRQQITLAEAQQAIASDWIAAYKRYFRTGAPLPSHLEPAEAEEAELMVVPDRPIQVATAATVGGVMPLSE